MEEGEDLWYFGTLGDMWRGSWESLEARRCEGNPTVEWDRIHGNRSCSLETQHSGRVESVDSLKLLKPGVPELLLTVDLSP
jgi:hypothetical protein